MDLKRIEIGTNQRGQTLRACEAELFWNSDDPWEKILMRARMRALPER
jgi:hypothetical protein